MPTARARSHAGGLALLVLLASACGGPDARSGPDADGPSPAPTAAPTSPAPAGPAGDPLDPGAGATEVVPADVPSMLQDVLDRRAAAVRAGDQARFLAGLMPNGPFRAREAAYFDRLARLPITSFSYRLVRASLVRTAERGYWGVVEVSLRLGRFDQRAVRTLDRFRFMPFRDHVRIASTRDAAWEARFLAGQEPWETGPVTVVRGSGVLGILDPGTRAHARDLVGSTEAGLADVSARVPYDWSRAVAFYALTDPDFLDRFDEVPGGDPQALDAVAFTVPTSRDDPTPASARFALSPALVASLRPGGRSAALDRLVRHELTHVAVGNHDDEAPVWLSEGVAEWVSWQAVRPAARRVPAHALAEARRGTLRLPADADFNDADADDHYALAWWICEWIVQTYSEQDLWRFLDAFTTLADEDDADVVEQVVHLSVDDLARRGARLMAQTYAPPEPPATPAPPADGETEGTEGAPPRDPSDAPATSGP